MPKSNPHSPEHKRVSTRSAAVSKTPRADDDPHRGWVRSIHGVYVREVTLRWSLRSDD